MEDMKRVVVVGAGVIGLSAALHLLERFPGLLDLTVMSDRFSPDTTSDKSGAIILLPILMKSQQGKNPSLSHRTQKWSRATFNKFHSIYRSEENAKVEICAQNGYVLLHSPLPDPWFKDEVFGFRHVEVDSREAGLINVPSNCVDVWSFGAYAVNPTSYLRWLTEKVRAGGAKFVQKKISSFDELSSYDIIINCTGLGSCELLGDQMLHPVQGQLVRVRAPWIKHWLADYDQDRFILPRSRDVVLGGTVVSGKWSETPDPDVTRLILQNCQEHMPSLCGAEVIDEWVGLRPFRDSVRLESCQERGARGSLLVHCYGHGGQGVILSWGCAQEIGDIVQGKVTTD